LSIQLIITNVDMCKDRLLFSI